MNNKLPIFIAVNDKVDSIISIRVMRYDQTMGFFSCGEDAEDSLFLTYTFNITDQYAVVIESDCILGIGFDMNEALWYLHSMCMDEKKDTIEETMYKYSSHIFTISFEDIHNDFTMNKKSYHINTNTIYRFFYPDVLTKVCQLAPYVAMQMVGIHDHYLRNINRSYLSLHDMEGICDGLCLKEYYKTDKDTKRDFPYNYELNNTSYNVNFMTLASENLRNYLKEIINNPNRSNLEFIRIYREMTEVGIDDIKLELENYKIPPEDLAWRNEGEIIKIDENGKQLLPGDIIDDKSSS